MSTEWRSHPKLQGRFQQDHPDDVQVLVHDGGPQVSDRQPELVWVRVIGSSGSVFRGVVLNRPQQLVTIGEGDEILFLVPDGAEYPLRVTEQYVDEREIWIIQPCSRCGLSELLDPPSTLMSVAFPSLPPDAIMDTFTAICGACGGVQVVKCKDGAEEEPSLPKPKPWWQFWK